MELSDVIQACQDRYDERAALGIAALNNLPELIKMVEEERLAAIALIRQKLIPIQAAYNRCYSELSSLPKDIQSGWGGLYVPYKEEKTGEAVGDSIELSPVLDRTLMTGWVSYKCEMTVMERYYDLRFVSDPLHPSTDVCLSISENKPESETTTPNRGLSLKRTDKNKPTRINPKPKADLQISAREQSSRRFEFDVNLTFRSESDITRPDYDALKTRYERELARIKLFQELPALIENALSVKVRKYNNYSSYGGKETIVSYPQCPDKAVEIFLDYAKESLAKYIGSQPKTSHQLKLLGERTQ